MAAAHRPNPFLKKGIDMKTPHLLLLSLVLSLALAACGKEEPAQAPAPAETAAPAMPAETEAAAPAETAAVADAGAGVDAHGMYAAKCASCHGDMGQGVADNPKLTGLSPADVESKLKDYRAGKQMGAKTAIMASIAKGLSDEEISALAGYLGE